MTAPVCCYCGRGGDLRPYGPDGAWTCWGCMVAVPAREAEAKGQFGVLLDTAGPVSILTESGPMPFMVDTPEEPQ